MRKKLRLYVWEDVLTDFSPGIMFALAYSVEDARKMLIEREPNSHSVKEEVQQEPKVYDNPMAFIMWGGGPI